MGVLRSIGSNEKIRVLFAGFGSLGLGLFRALLKSPDVATIVAILPASNVKRYRFLEKHPAQIELMRLAIENEIRILNAPSINSPQFLTDLDELKPHVLQIGSWSEIIKPLTLSVQDVTIINCHGSLLPKYRGACPCLATIFNGDKQTGLTIHLIDEGIDTGDTLLQQTVDILPGETTIQLDDRMAKKFGEAIVPLYRDLKAGKIAPRKQHGESSYIPSPNPEWGWIPWHQSPIVIDQRMRALSGELPLVTLFGDLVLGFDSGKVVKSVATNSNTINFNRLQSRSHLGAGIVLAADSDKVIVSTRDRNVFVELDMPVFVPTGETAPSFRPGDRFYSIECKSILKSA